MKNTWNNSSSLCIVFNRIVVNTARAFLCGIAKSSHPIVNYYASTPYVSLAYFHFDAVIRHAFRTVRFACACWPRVLVVRWPSRKCPRKSFSTLLWMGHPHCAWRRRERNRHNARFDLGIDFNSSHKAPFCSMLIVCRCFSNNTLHVINFGLTSVCHKQWVKTFITSLKQKPLIKSVNVGSIDWRKEMTVSFQIVATLGFVNLSRTHASDREW